jgi:hypothetical protein
VRLTFPGVSKEVSNRRLSGGWSPVFLEGRRAGRAVTHTEREGGTRAGYASKGGC